MSATDQIKPEQFNLSKIIRGELPPASPGTSFMDQWREGQNYEYLKWFFIRVMTVAAGDGDMFEKFGLRVPLGPDDDHVIDVVLTINGVQVPIREFLFLFRDEGERLVNETAVELVKSKFQDLEGAVRDLKERAERVANEMFGVRGDDD